VLLILGALVLVVIVVLTGAADLASDHHRLEGAISGAGIRSLLVFLALMTLLVALGLPGLAFIFAASAIWSAPTAIGVILAGGLAASYVRFSFARSIGRRWVEGRLTERLRRWNDRLGHGGLGTVVLLRLLFNLSAPPDWILGLSQVRARTFLAGTLIGRIPPTVILVVVGGEILPRLWPPPTVMVLGAFVPWAAVIVRRRRLASAHLLGRPDPGRG
jgi:uncharacterized membrane protein YdjX (TVP38/TMEM64 family)